jgi:hypothetical protein
MTPAEEIVTMHRDYGHRLYICRAVDRLDRSIYRKVRYEAIKGLIVAGLIMAIAFLIALCTPRALAQKQLQFKLTQVVAPGWSDCTTGDGCLTGYTIYETTSGVAVQVASVPQTATVYDLPIPSVGVHTYAVTQNGINGLGLPVQSTGNPGVVVSCWKVTGGRQCKVGKVWE